MPFCSIHFIFVVILSLNKNLTLHSTPNIPYNSTRKTTSTTTAKSTTTTATTTTNDDDDDSNINYDDNINEHHI